MNQEMRRFTLPDPSLSTQRPLLSMGRRVSSRDSPAPLTEHRIN
jgi:hypothetical protein